jgi:hypothetical protein
MIQHVIVKSARTSPTAETWSPSAELLGNTRFLTVSHGAPTRMMEIEGQRRRSTLTSLDETLNDDLTLLSPLNAISAIRIYDTNHNDLDIFSCFYDNVKEVCTQDLWSVLVTHGSQTSATAMIGAALRSNKNSTAVTTKLYQIPVWRSEPNAPDPIAGFGKYSVPNWDGYGAEPIEPKTTDSARSFIRILPDTFGAADIAPGADGTIGLEWVLGEGPLRKLFIDIGPGPVWSAYWRRTSGDRGSLSRQNIDARTKAVLTKLFADLSS